MPRLDEHIPGPLSSVRFFNGRLLTGSDLTREQQALYERDERVAAALGSGVVFGLEVSAGGGSTPAVPQVTVSAGRGINPSGTVLVLSATTTVDLILPTTPTKPPRADWRRCEDEPSDPPAVLTGTERGIFLLTVRWEPKDSTTLARVLQVDRSNDPCTVDSVVEGLAFRLIRMEALEGATSTVSDLRIRNVVAHACYGTAAIPAHPEDDASAAARAIDALRSLADEPLTDCDLPLAVLCITRSGGLQWVDNWAARRRLVPPLLHTAWERTTGPRALAEAEARLLQFEGELDGFPLPANGGTAGTARSRFAWLPPAGELDLGWSTGDAWRHFFGSNMSPSAPIACDAALLPALLSHAATDAAIPTETEVASVPAIDVYAGRAEGEGATTALVFVQSTDGRVLVDLTGAALTETVVAALKVRLTSDDGLRAWDAVQQAGLTTWLSPNLEPGAYDVSVVSASVAGVPVPLNVVGGRVRRTSIAVTPLTGTIRVFVEEDKYTEVYRVNAVKGGETRSITSASAGVWTFTGVPVGPWNITALAHGRYGDVSSETEPAQVQAGATVDVHLGFFVMPERPGRTVTFPWQKGVIKIAILEASITELDEDQTVVIKDFDTWAIYGKEAEARGSYLKQLDRETNYARAEYEFDTGERTTGGKAVVLQGKSGAKDHKAGKLVNVAKERGSKGYTRWGDPPTEVRTWLAAWQQWVGANEADHRVRGKVRDNEPFIELLTGKDIAALAAAATVGKAPEGYAVFGATRMPIAVTREKYRIPTPYTPDRKQDLLKRLKAYELEPDWGIDELASWPKDLIEEVFPVPIGDPEELVKDLGRTAEEVKGDLSYLPGMDEAVLAGVGGSLTTLANLGTTDLTNLGLDSLTAALLLHEARAAAPTAGWAIAESDVTSGARLSELGYTTVKEVASADVELLAMELGVSVEAAGKVRGEAEAKLVDAVVGEALSVVTAMATEEVATTELDLAALGDNAAGAAVTHGISETFAKEGIKANERLATAVGSLGFERVDAKTNIKLGR